MRNQLQGQEREISGTEGDRAAEAVRRWFASANFSEEQQRTLPLLLRHFWVLTVVFAALGIVLSRIVHTRLLFPHPYPWTDLYIYQFSFTHFRTRAFYLPGPAHASGYTYPNTMALFYWCYYAVAHPLVAYFATIAAVVAAAVTAFARQLIRRRFSPKTVWLFSLSLAATSYPLWFLVEGANFEIFVLLFAGLGVAAYLSKRYWWAGALIGIAASLKYFPVILFALLFQKKYYKQLLFGLVVGCSWFLLSNWIVGPTFADALRGSGGTLGGYTTYYVNGIRAQEIGYDHSLYSVVKHVYLVVQTLTGPLTHKLAQVYQVYIAFAILLAILLFFARLKKLPPLNQALAIVCMMLLLPPVSYDYRLLHLYVPFAFFVFWMIEQKGVADKASQKFLALFAILFTPQTFLLYWIGRYGVAFPVTYGAQVKTFSLLGLLVFAALYPMAESKWASPNEEIALTMLEPAKAGADPA
jgi:hypothetical protein